MVAIVTRAQWGARPAKKRTPVAASKRRQFMAHYVGASPQVRPHTQCAAAVRGMQRQHHGQGWHDIGYNFLVCQHGTVYEGRGWDVAGSHCPGYNTSAWGAQFIIGGTQEPSDPAKSSMRALYDAATARAGRPLSKLGHSDGVATECPGVPAYRWVRAGMPRPGKPTTPPPTKPNPVPPPQPTPPQSGDTNMPTADEIATEVWTRPVDDSTGRRRTAGFAQGATFRNTEAGNAALAELVAALDQVRADLAGLDAKLDVLIDTGGAAR